MTATVRQEKRMPGGLECAVVAYTNREVWR
jgi:hypothetical protein